jgi:hypothetical protein
MKIISRKFSYSHNSLYARLDNHLTQQNNNIYRRLLHTYLLFITMMGITPISINLYLNTMMQALSIDISN